MDIVLRRTIVLGLATVFAVSPVFAADKPDTSDLLAQITALEQIANKDEAAAPDDPHLQKALGRVRILENMVQHKNFNSAYNAATEISVEDRTEAMQKALTPIEAELAQARDAQMADAAGDLKKVLDDATDAVKTKTDPKDFDSILAEIAAALSANFSREGGYRQGDNQQLQSASRFVRDWQSYLIEEKAGNPQMAANDLRNLTMQENSFMPIPRSELLERAMKESGQAAGPAAFNAKIEIHSLDDLPAAIAQLEVLQRSGGFSMEANNLLNAMQNLRTAWLSYQDKNYSAALQQLTMNPFFGGMINGVQPVGGTPSGDQDALRKELAALKNQLMLEIVQGLLNLPDLAAPQPGELASDYLLRLAEAREKAADWTGLQEVLLVYQQAAATFGMAAWLQEDLAGLHAYLVGEKLEGAGQNLDAIRSYRQALATIGKFFPADPPAAKLNELQKKYPDLYQQALQQPIIPRGP
jgi:hypothetical protein